MGTWAEFFTAFGVFVTAVLVPSYLLIRRELAKERVARDRREEVRARRSASLTAALRDNTQATDAARRATADQARVLTGMIRAQPAPNEEPSE